MEKIIVELEHHRQAKEWREVDIEEARRILKIKMNPGWRWHLPLWQFQNDQGDRPENEMHEMRRRAYRELGIRIATAKLEGGAP